MATVKIVDLTRECQYCCDTFQGRVRCGRLALSAIGTGRNPSFRCRVHEGLNNDQVTRRVGFNPVIRYIESNNVFGLGYKP